MRKNPVTLTQKTLIPIGFLAGVITVGIWVGRVETKLEAHSEELAENPAKLEKISTSLTAVRESLARIEGVLGVRSTKKNGP